MVVRGKRTIYKTDNKIGLADWVGPASIMKRWTFIMPHGATCKAAGDLWSLKPDDWRVRVRGMRTGFQVRSVEQAVCIMKLAYFDLGRFIPELCLFVHPEAILEFASKTIVNAKRDPDHPNWIDYLGLTLSGMRSGGKC